MEVMSMRTFVPEYLEVTKVDWAFLGERESANWYQISETAIVGFTDNGLAIITTKDINALPDSVMQFVDSYSLLCASKGHKVVEVNAAIVVVKQLPKF